jgi:hypothetical protein
LNNLVTDLVVRILNLSRLVVLSLSVFLVMTICFSSFAVAQQNGSSATISAAQDKLASCYFAAKTAEEAGANISGLTNILDAAGALLSKAKYAYSVGDFGSAQNLAIESQGVLKNFVSEANSLKASAAYGRSVNFWVNIVGSVAGTVAVIAGSFVVWSLLKRRYGNSGVRQLESSKV